MARDWADDLLNWMNARWTPVDIVPKLPNIDGLGFMPASGGNTEPTEELPANHPQPFWWSKTVADSEHAEENLVAQAKRFFAMIIPGGKCYWRAYPEFFRDAKFGDIERPVKLYFRCSISLPDDKHVISGKPR